MALIAFLWCRFSVSTACVISSEIGGDVYALTQNSQVKGYVGSDIQRPLKELKFSPSIGIFQKLSKIFFLILLFQGHTLDLNVRPERCCKPYAPHYFWFLYQVCIIFSHRSDLKKVIRGNFFTKYYLPLQLVYRYVSQLSITSTLQEMSQFF